ncbi:uncharacterized protein SCDLUD_003884 [Saccharomycodes ludwigii]|uniref:uncharacterized protein n=1 Tax=Saccharomycodes ludwigii TaxID=36035 RepID=UPI001E822BC3|nr:hypothetical protein SCDLUD_003884 [Saccharomycodes ludwigii]KAH3899604.1 hypothetical protein SCDLUD_003884 [Saccharomycodes ludwigii]
MIPIPNDPALLREHIYSETGDLHVVLDPRTFSDIDGYKPISAYGLGYFNYYMKTDRELREKRVLDEIVIHVYNNFNFYFIIFWILFVIYAVDTALDKKFSKYYYSNNISNIDEEYSSYTEDEDYYDDDDDEELYYDNGEDEEDDDEISLPEMKYIKHSKKDDDGIITGNTDKKNKAQLKKKNRRNKRRNYKKRVGGGNFVSRFLYKTFYMKNDDQKKYDRLYGDDDINSITSSQFEYHHVKV